jgi:hypothetical protein
MKATALQYMLGTLLFLFCLPARAASGTVSGTFKLWNINGNYCTGSCSGANYPSSQNDSAQPAKNVKVFVWNDTSGLLGQGTTNNNGAYTVAWNFVGSLPQPQQTYVYWAPNHKDGRFFINNAAGAYPWWRTDYFTAQNGSAFSIGTFTAGSNAASADPWANTYWAAELL